jgi:hypothetical protein
MGIISLEARVFCASSVTAVNGSAMGPPYSKNLHLNKRKIILIKKNSLCLWLDWAASKLFVQKGVSKV